MGGAGASQLLRVKSFVDTRQSPRGSAHRPTPTENEASESLLGENQMTIKILLVCRKLHTVRPMNDEVQ